jgi:lauroyl/myristoyl acyltransferase
MGVWLTGWALLGEALLEQVEHRLWWLVGAMAAMLVMCLWLAFGRWFEVLLSLGTLAFSLLVLQACMGLAGASWNLMNLMALPLLLGAGVDYTIHVQLALRRHGGEVRTMRRVTGVAVFLCAATTAAGFGSLAWSRSPGLASLGLVCAAGIAAVYGSAVFLLPAWWQRLNGRSATPPNWPPAVEGTPSPVHGSSLKAGLRTQRGPSAFYRVEVWRLGQMLGCLLPAPVLHGLCLMVAEVYCRLRRQRREVVVENLLPAMANNRAAAEKSARELFRQFAHKLADLWRCESGAPAHEWFAELAGWEEFQAARGRGRGVLLLTPHLGNWELGGPLLAQRGVNLLVITQPEPGHRFTEFRSASRARWGIETLVIGHDGFAFVEVIKRLQAGATVALLIDRPGEPSAVRVELFGRPFRASVAAAELARVSGCALLGVAIVRARGGYSARFLPEFNYVRAELGNREARRQLMQQIVRAFEPEIQKHPDQWYHFVPIWPDAGQTR